MFNHFLFLKGTKWNSLSSLPPCCPGDLALRKRRAQGFAYPGVEFGRCADPAP